MAMQPTGPEVKPLHGLCATLTVLLGLSALVTTVGIFLFYHQVTLLQGLREGIKYSQETGDANDAMINAISMARSALYVITAIPFLMWMYRACNNLMALGLCSATYKPSEAVWGFFIPFLNLVRPYQVAQQIWECSVADRRSSGTVGPAPASFPIVGVWWGTLIIAVVLIRLAGIGATTDPPNLDVLLQGTWMGIVFCLFMTISAIAALLMIRTVTNSQYHVLDAQPIS
jgi:hypothetical protein